MSTAKLSKGTVIKTGTAGPAKEWKTNGGGEQISLNKYNDKWFTKIK